MRNDIKVIYDNDYVTIMDGDRLVTEGSGAIFNSMAENVINKIDTNKYNVTEKLEGHKRVITLRVKQ